STEIFDLTPTPTSTFFPYVVEPAFTARDARSTSTLRAAPGYAPTGWWDAASGLILGGFGGFGGQVYDLQRFELTTRDGTVYLVDKDEGLLKGTGRFGNTTESTETGIISSSGPDIEWERNEDGTIDHIDLPDSTTISYAYDETTGDLEVVTN